MLLPYWGSSGTRHSLSLKSNPTASVIDHLGLFVNIVINAEGKFSFLPYVLFTKYLKPIRIFISITIGHELFTCIYRTRRFPLNITGKQKGRAIRVKWSQSQNLILNWAVAHPHNLLLIDMLVTHCTQEIPKITLISRVGENIIGLTPKGKRTVSHSLLIPQTRSSQSRVEEEGPPGRSSGPVFLGLP